MAGIENLIQAEENGAISFGNHELPEKKKQEDFAHAGDLYKVKTFRELTKLERNGMFVYESEPGTTVRDYAETNSGISFFVEGNEDAQITVQLEEDTAYEVFIDGASIGDMKTNMSGKLTVGAELNAGAPVQIRIIKK